MAATLPSVPATSGLARRAGARCHAAVGGLDRRLPRGVVHLCLQLQIWIAFYFAYNVTRGLADRDADAALANGEWIARTQERLGTLFEPELQRAVESALMTELMAYTYWLSQFVVVGGALFWVYLRRHEWFSFLRNWLLVANTVGLVFYALVPTAPPRMLGHWGFSDTLAASSTMDHGTVGTLANQFAAMPSLHVMDALIVGGVLCAVARRRTARVLWALWPAWVAFAVLATGNHYWLDVAVGMLVAVATAFALLGLRRLENRSLAPHAPHLA
jgi:membrane-associated phospholipid phosphatase